MSDVYTTMRKRIDATREGLDMSGRYRPFRSRLSREDSHAEQRLRGCVKRSHCAVPTKHSSNMRARETRARSPRQLHERRILPRKVKTAKFSKMAPTLDRTGSRVVAFIQRRGSTLPLLTLPSTSQETE